MKIDNHTGAVIIAQNFCPGLTPGRMLDLAEAIREYAKQRVQEERQNLSKKLDDPAALKHELSQPISTTVRFV